jgi:hypothetical protein
MIRQVAPSAYQRRVALPCVPLTETSSKVTPPDGFRLVPSISSAGQLPSLRATLQLASVGIR